MDIFTRNYVSLSSIDRNSSSQKGQALYRGKTKSLLKFFLCVILLCFITIPGTKAHFHVAEVTRITTDELLDRGGWLIQDTDGRFLAYYASYDTSTDDYNIRMSYSSDGMDWSTPKTIFYGKLGPSAIQDQDGIYWLTYNTYRYPSVIWISKSSNGIEWDTPQQIASTATSPSLIQDQNGIYWLAYESRVYQEDDGRITWVGSDLLIRNSGDGVDWNPPIYVTSAHYSYGSISLIQDSNGRYWVAWHREGGTIWISSSNDGLSWTTPTQILTGMYS